MFLLFQDTDDDSQLLRQRKMKNHSKMSFRVPFRIFSFTLGTCLVENASFLKKKIALLEGNTAFINENQYFLHFWHNFRRSSGPH